MLCIAEKHSVAKKMVQLFSNDYKTDKITKFNFGYQLNLIINTIQTNVIIIHGSGHSKEYRFTNQQQNGFEYYNCDIVSKVSDYGSGLVKSIKYYINKIQTLVLCQDNDREGEHIAWQAVEIASQEKTINIYPSSLPETRRKYAGKIISEAHLQHNHIQCRRCRFSSLTKNDVLNALSNLQPINVHIVDAVDIRQQLDLRIGYAMSSLQGKNSHQLMRNVQISESHNQQQERPHFTFGTCQIPTLGLCYCKKPQKLERTSFMYAQLASIPQQLSSKTELALVVRDQAIQCNQQLIQNNKTYVQMTESQGCIHPPPPLNTKELLKQFSDMKPDIVMKVAESLYQKGFISYPRTETQVFTNDMDSLKIVQNLQSITTFQNYIQTKLLADQTKFKNNLNQILKRNGQNKYLQNDESHPPIHPLKVTTELNGAEQQVYLTVCKCYLASISFDCITTEHQYSTIIANIQFSCSQKYITFPGFQEILYNKMPDIVPNFPTNNKLVVEVENLFIRDSKEQSVNNNISQSALIEMMDQYGVGTDATFPEHIKTIQERDYIGNNYQVKTLGQIICQLYLNVNINVLSVVFRSMMEAGLREVCSGKQTPQQVYKDIMTMSVKLYRDVERYLYNKK